MANINENLLVKGARGNVAKQFVYRTHGGNTNIVKMPKKNKNRKPTEEQQAFYDRFTSASLYGQGVIEVPELKAAYQKKAKPGQTAFNVAFTDFLQAPEVKNIDATEYDGSIGSVIRITAIDDFKVESVKVSIYDAAGTLVEQGMAVVPLRNRAVHVYTATQPNGAVAGSKIRVTATDLPGNKGFLEITV